MSWIQLCHGHCRRACRAETGIALHLQSPPLDRRRCSLCRAGPRPLPRFPVAPYAVSPCLDDIRLMDTPQPTCAAALGTPTQRSHVLIIRRYVPALTPSPGLHGARLLQIHGWPHEQLELQSSPTQPPHSSPDRRTRGVRVSPRCYRPINLDPTQQARARGFDESRETHP